MTGVANATETRAVESERGMSTFAQVRWLAGQEIKHSWLSYPVTALVMLIFGYITASIADGFLVVEGSEEGGRIFADKFNAFYADYFFLTFSAFLAVNWMSREYLRIFSEDAFSERLVFVRGLPISAATMVLGRMMSLSFSFPFNTPAFFIPVYLISNLKNLGWNFLWFVAVWFGFSLLGIGISLLAEFTISGRAYVWMTFIGVFLLIFVLIVLEFTVELRAVSRIAGLVESYGPLPAVVSILFGAVMLWIMAKMTIRRVERRDLYA